MEVSVILVTRNTCALTWAAVQSVLDSRDAPAREILVVDNGSTDGTASMLPREFRQIQFLRSEKNLGFARAVNLAAREAAGEFLLLLNSDARLATDALAQAVTWMRGQPEAAVAGAQLLNADDTRQNSIANFPTLATELLNKSLLRRLRPGKFPGKEHEFREPVEVESVVGAFMLIRKNGVGRARRPGRALLFLFRGNRFLPASAAERPSHFFICRPSVVWHGQGQSIRQVSAGARIEYWRSRYVYFAKNHSRAAGRILAAGLAVRLLFDSLAAGLLVLATFGKNARWRNRWQVCTALLRWHWRGRPAEMGLPR